MNSLLSFIIVLGVLIFVHEFGHFLLAKAFGVRVLTFSLGFGNKLIGRKWGNTEYLISAFPLGGYVKMYGEQPDEPVPPELRHCSFSHKPVWQRFCVVFGGPLFNLLFALLLAFAMFAFVGMPDWGDSTKIGQVMEKSAGEQAGLRAGDVVLSIDGLKIETWNQIPAAVETSNGKPLTIVVKRQDQEQTVIAQPLFQKQKNAFGEEVGEKRYLLGVMRSTEFKEPLPLLEAGEKAALYTWNSIALTLEALVKIIQRIVPASELGGPIRIAEIAGEQLDAGWMNLVLFMGLLSVNLGILNLLPIPVLDGGHLVFLILEAIRGKTMSERAMGILQRIGIALLGMLMLFVFYNDILRLVRRWLAP